MKSEYSKKQINDAMKWVLRHEEGLSECQRREFEIWKKEHPNHEKCFFEHQVGWSSLDTMRFWKPSLSSEPNPDLFVSTQSSRFKQYGVPFLAMAACLLLAIGFFTWRHAEEGSAGTEPMFAEESYEGGKQHFLSDGSSFYLKKGSRLEVVYTETARNLYLKEGEAVFEVAKDPSRPFRVSTNRTQVVALGTVFSVNANDSFCEVYVTEGKVRLNQLIGEAETGKRAENLVEELRAGEMANVPMQSGALHPRIQAFALKDFQLKMRWKDQIIEMVSAPLFEIIEEFNRYNSVDIFVTDPDLRRIRMSVSVNPDNEQEFLQLLEMTMPVEVVHTPTGIYIQSRNQ